MEKQPGIVEILTDDDIIARILSGNKELYAQLIKKYNARLYRVAMAIVNNDTEVEDVMQAAYLKAYEHLGQFTYRSAFSTWLTRILVNECLLKIKLKKRMRVVDETVLDRKPVDVYSPLMKTPSDNMLNTELKSILENSIRNLPEKYRVVFVMREIEGLSVAETQECLDLTEANVKVRLNRAKALLKESLSAYYRKEDILHFHLTRCDRMVVKVMYKINKTA